MKKSTKGVIAASAAGVLLLGGAGSLAYWTAEGSADGGSITAGELKLADGECGDGWVYAPGSAGAGDAVTLFVPGDTVRQVCTFDLTATGDNLAATIAVPTSFTPTETPTLTSADFTVTGAFEISDNATPTPVTRTIANGGTVTSADNGSTITATIDVTVPFGTDEDGTPVVNGNDTQNLLAEFSDITVGLTQDDPNEVQN